MPADYSWKLEQSDSGVGFQGNLGAQYALSDKVKLGAVWRSGTKVALNGSAASTTSNVDAILAAEGLPIATNVRSDVKVEYVYPMSYGVGLSYKAASDLLLALGVDTVNYYALRNETTYLTPGAVFTDTNQGMDWHDTVKVHIGAQYRVDKQLSILAGADDDPCPFTRTSLTLLNANQYDAYTYSIGATYNIWDNIEFGGMFHYTVTDQPESAGITYQLPIIAIQVSASYRI
jgi:long-subunit fatty acid transport protein